MSDEEKYQKKSVTKTEKKVFSNNDQHNNGYDNVEDDDSSKGLGTGKRKSSLGTRKVILIIAIVFLVAGGVAAAAYFIADDLTKSDSTKTETDTNVQGAQEALKADEKQDESGEASTTTQESSGSPNSNAGLRSLRGVPRSAAPPGGTSAQAKPDVTETPETKTATTRRAIPMGSMRSLRTLPKPPSHTDAEAPGSENDATSKTDSSSDDQDNDNDIDNNNSDNGNDNSNQLVQTGVGLRSLRGIPRKPVATATHSPDDHNPDIKENDDDNNNKVKEDGQTSNGSGSDDSDGTRSGGMARLLPLKATGSALASTSMEEDTNESAPVDSKTTSDSTKIIHGDVDVVDKDDDNGDDDDDNIVDETA